MPPRTACFIVDSDAIAAAHSETEASADHLIYYVRDHVTDSFQPNANVEVRRLPDALDLDLELARQGNIREITDLAGDGLHAKAQRVRQLFFALAPGGIYRIQNAEVRQESDGFAGWLQKTLARIAACDSERAILDAVSEQGQDNFAKAIAKVIQCGDGWEILKAGSHLVRLRDSDANEELEKAFGKKWGRLITSLPATETPRPAALHMHYRKRPHRDLDSVGPTPPLHMREYNDVIAAPRQILIKGNYFLPDTFRLHQHPRLNHDLLVYSSDTRSAIDPIVHEASLIDGVYYYLDTIYPGHFGHVMTEVLSRLWGWDEAKRLHPGIKALVSVRNAGEKVPEYEFDLLEAYGIRRDEVYVLERPAKLEKLVAVTPMFHNTRYVSPQIKTHWDRIRAGMGIASNAKKRRKIFVGRALSRGCVNSAEVEAAFRYYGFEVIRPEKHSMREQIEVFSSAAVVAGFAGSGMFTAMFSDSPTVKIVISQEAYNAINEYLQSCVTGDDIHYFWCEPSLDHPPGQWSLAAFRSNFSFDFINQGDALYNVLESLE